MTGISLRDVWWNHGGWRTIVISLYPTSNVQKIVSHLAECLYEGGFLPSSDPDEVFEEMFIVNELNPGRVFLIIHHVPEIEPMEGWLVEHYVKGFEGHTVHNLNSMLFDRINYGLAYPVQMVEASP